jgi:hypothetical protein
MSFEPLIDFYGRWTFWVDSETRPGLRHLVDLEPELDIAGRPEHGGEPWKCSCEAHHYNVTRPCKHVRAILKWIAPIMRFIRAFPGAIPLGVTKASDSASSHETRRPKYQLDPHKKYDPTIPDPPTPQRRLHPGVHRQPPADASRRGSRLDIRRGPDGAS